MFRYAVYSLALCVSSVVAAPVDSNTSNGAADNERPLSATLSVAPDQTEVLLKARTANDDLYSALKAFVCREEIQRYRGDLNKTKIRYVDHVSTNLSFENGVERYNDVRQNTRSVGSLPEINGAWSEGEFGTLLQQTEKLLEFRPVTFIAYETVADVKTIIYRFEVDEKSSMWDLSVGTEHYKIPFMTDVWISASTGEIVKISRRSISIPEDTHISEIDWDVTLMPVELNGKSWLLPSSAIYSVSYSTTKRREWNEMSFSDYRRYGSESTLRFDGF